MPKHTQSNACNACASSKRKCGRQLPKCARCTDRGESCIYWSRIGTQSASRSLLPDFLRSSIPTGEAGLLEEVAGNTSSYTAGLSLLDDLTSDLATMDPILDLDLDLDFPLTISDFAAPSLLGRSLSVPASSAVWFLGPGTWNVTHTQMESTAGRVSKAAMKRYISLLQTWFECWITTGSNPFIHASLYSASFPACVQVAYVTLASYVHRTPTNTDTVIQIVEDRSNDLLRANGAVLDNFDAAEWVDREEEDVDLFAQLTRLHALMVYQIIGLLDGDIRSRHIAEGHMAVQISWAGKLLRSAAKGLSDTQTAAKHLVGSLAYPSTYSQQQWYLWTLSESIRRTWLVAVSICSIYSALQRRWAICPGGIMYTNRSGLWNAASATEWNKQCSERNVALQRFECTRVFDEMVPADIDEFGTAILDVSYNEELLETWRARSGVLQV